MLPFDAPKSAQYTVVQDVVSTAADPIDPRKSVEAGLVPYYGTYRGSSYFGPSKGALGHNSTEFLITACIF